jgi:DNA-binding CsgD family transcriptional regulator
MSIETGRTSERGSAAAGPDVPGSPGARTVAHVDLRPSATGNGTSDLIGCSSPEWSALLRRALHNIEQTVRSDDRVCPYGMSRIAIAFGPDADAVPPKVLGERLARAVGRGLVSDSPAPSNHPSATSLHHPGGVLNGKGATSRRPRVGSIPSTTVVTVERLLDGGWPAASPVVPLALRPPGGPGPSSQLRHRTIIRYSTRRLAGYGTRHDDHRPISDHALGAVLVVDPDPTAAGSPGLAALATTTLAERLGYKTGVISLTGDASVVTEIDGVGLDLVVLMVAAEPAGAHSSWAGSTWCVPAQLAGAYRSLGIETLAVSAGAGAGALTGCLEQGANVLFDLNALPAELLELSRSGTLGSERTMGRHSVHLPPTLQSLLVLTSSERRVLYFLTVGRSAQEIADELVVSLATVRSHIRSVLRKLGVRSQLAAVAVANSRGLAPAEPARAS